MKPVLKRCVSCLQGFELVLWAIKWLGERLGPLPANTFQNFCHKVALLDETWRANCRLAVVTYRKEFQMFEEDTKQDHEMKYKINLN